ncbi:MAG: TrkH family potassium uptake protein [Candidatus Saganbacteria bacterium]|nr:TrkH family potassium uptake protein [Candidatus Saganbacteria bacterium]
MLIKPSLEDLKVIGFNIGRIVIAFGLTMLIPMITGLALAEWGPALDFAITLLICLIVGELLLISCKTNKDLSWGHGLVVTATSWLIAMILGAIPLFYSGHYGSFLDSCFDSMSGIATTGLALIQNLDHLSHAHNMWRHLLMFLGGQGIIVIGLTFLIRGSAGAYRLYVGEAREEKIMPNVIQTARFIWSISFIYLMIGILVLSILFSHMGISLIRSFLHSIWIFMAAYDTGGFTPHSQSILYYHSFMVELVTIAFMILGTLNFSMHFALWSGNSKEFRKNIEVFTLISSISIICVVALVSLIQFSTYSNWIGIFRKGFYQIISAHSGTGFMTLYPSQFNAWGPLGVFAVMLAMALGGSACSTAGGIKALRVGLSIKTLIKNIRSVLSPGGAIIIEKFHHIKDVVLSDKIIRSTLVITLIYIMAYFVGTGIGLFYGYPLQDAAFEAVSACANVGLSVGVTAPTMPNGLKVTYIILMWLGRLEFMSIFALIGFFIAMVRGK